MLRLAVFLIVVVAAAAGLAWLAERPGEMLINWEGYEVRITVFTAVVSLAILVGLSILLWSIARGIWQSPASIGNFFNRRREKRGLEALSSGMIAIGAGDRSLATKYAIQARKSLPNEPMTHLLRAQAARLAGDQTTARRIFEAMLSAPDTEQLGLRGLFLEAEKEGEREAAKQFAERAIKLNPKLSWPVDALLGIQCREHDWAGALETLAVAKKNGHVEKPTADRKRAVLLTAQAQAAEDSDPERALALALEAHGLASDLIPAAAIAGRILAARGNTGRAVKVIAKTWKKAPHPDLAVAYAYARLGDSPKDRYERVAKLAAMAPNIVESPIALANAAIEARDFAAARRALESIDDSRQTQRVCTLMARIEGEEHNAGGVREWLARAVNAPRDPAWTADGIVANEWSAVSPVTGALDAFQWRVPVEAAEPRDKELLASKIDELAKLGVRPESMIAGAAAAGGAGLASVAGDDAEDVEPVDAKASEVQTDADSKTSGVVDAEVVEVVKVVSAEVPASRSATPEEGSKAPEAAMKVVDIEPPPKAVPPSSPVKPEAEPKPEVAAAGANGAEAAKPAEPVVVLAKEGSGRAAPSAGKSKTVEPKIFVSPRAPDDPGPIADSKK